MIRMKKYDDDYGRTLSQERHLEEARRQLDEAIARTNVDTRDSVQVGDDRVSVRTWPGACRSMATIVAEIGFAHPDMRVERVTASDWRHPVEKGAILLHVQMGARLCYTVDDELVLVTPSDLKLEGVEKRIGVQVGDDVAGAFRAVQPALKALMAEERRRIDKREAERAARKADEAARDADGRALGEHLASLILAGDALGLAEAVNAAMKAMPQHGVTGATRAAMMADMFGGHPFGVHPFGVHPFGRMPMGRGSMRDRLSRMPG